LGSIFVITLVMGDFFVVKIMSGGRSAPVVMAVFEDVTSLLSPGASAVVLLIIVALIVSLILRVVDVRKELTG
jgi:putative spermidine/putrescine transport system permease protein